jgi:hypothetical protein
MASASSHRGWSRRQFIGTTAAAAGDAMDVSQSPMKYLANYIDQGSA